MSEFLIPPTVPAWEAEMLRWLDDVPPAGPGVSPNDERRGLPSASAYGLWRKCPGQLGIAPSVPPLPATAAMRRGTRLHAMLAQDADPEAGDPDEMLTVEILQGRFERAASDWFGGESRRPADNRYRVAAEGRLFMRHDGQAWRDGDPVGSAAVSGRFDRLAWGQTGDGAVYGLAADFKTGWSVSDLGGGDTASQFTRDQLVAYGVLADARLRRVHPEGRGFAEMRLVLAARPRAADGQPVALTLTAADLDRARRQLLSDLGVDRGIERLEAGTHCALCPSKAGCPAMKLKAEETRALTPARKNIPTMTLAELEAFLIVAKPIAAAVKDAEARVRHILEHGPAGTGVGDGPELAAGEAEFIAPPNAQYYRLEARRGALHVTDPLATLRRLREEHPAFFSEVDDRAVLLRLAAGETGVPVARFLGSVAAAVESVRELAAENLVDELAGFGLGEDVARAALAAFSEPAAGVEDKHAEGQGDMVPPVALPFDPEELETHGDARRAPTQRVLRSRF